MKERPILFRGDLVRAILEGRKTMTRRPVKPQPITKRAESAAKVIFSSEWKGKDLTDQKEWFLAQCPYGTVGDRLWVRERMKVSLLSKGKNIEVIYGADGAVGKFELKRSDDKIPIPIEEHNKGWKPGFYMPRWASRILLEITSVRVERIKDISDADIMAEGYRDDSPLAEVPADGLRFMKSWNATYPGSWDRNDWVWVIEFKRVQL